MVGIINLKWHDAMQDEAIQQEFTQDEQNAGWPARMSAPQLAAMQRPRYFPLRKQLIEADPTDPVAAAQIKQTSANRVLLGLLQADFDAGHGPDTAPLFAAWLAAQGETPSAHVAAWFEAVGLRQRPIDAPAGVPAPQGTRPERRKRRDLMTPAIEMAQKECSDPYDVPAVFAELRRLAGEKVRPLIGVTPEGIQWTDGNDDPQFLSLNSLRERLRRQKKTRQPFI